MAHRGQLVRGQLGLGIDSDERGQPAGSDQRHWHHCRGPYTPRSERATVDEQGFSRRGDHVGAGDLGARRAQGASRLGWTEAGSLRLAGVDGVVA